MPLSPQCWTTATHFIGIPGRSHLKLQYTQNNAATILMRVRKHHPITPILASLHWLPISFRFEFKTLLLISNNCSPSITPPAGQAIACSSTPPGPIAAPCGSGFQLDRPSLWNALHDHLKAPQTLGSFKTGLKTFIFRKAFC